jgi:hypothetical protein
LETTLLQPLGLGCYSFCFSPGGFQVRDLAHLVAAVARERISPLNFRLVARFFCWRVSCRGCDLFWDLWLRLVQNAPGFADVVLVR